MINNFIIRETKDLEYLKKFSKHQHWYARWCVGQNPATPHHILHVLSKDENFIVRGSVARNPSTHSDILHVLSKDNDNFVRNCALETLKGKKE